MAIKSFFEKMNLQQAARSNESILDSTMEVSAPAGGSDDYLEKIKKDIDSNRISIVGNPMLKCAHPYTQLSKSNDNYTIDGHSLKAEIDVAKVAMRLDVYAWVPEKIFPDVRIKCPSCNSIVGSGRWCREKILHGLAQQTIYITKEYICYKCTAASRSKRTETSGVILSKSKARK